MSTVAASACVAFQLIASAVSLDMSVGSADVHALIDSGATASIMATDLAERLGLKPLNFGARLHSDTGSSRARLVGPVDVVIGGRAITLPYVVVSSDYLAMVNRTGRDAQFIAGQDTLNGSVVEFDFSKRCVRFYPPEHIVADAGYTALQLRRDELARYVASIRIGELPESDAIIDLGNTSPLMLSAEHFAKTGLERGRRTSTAAIGMSSGVVTSEAFTLPSVTIAGFRMNDIPVQMVPGWQSRQPVNMGLPLLQNFNVILDAPHAKIWFKAFRHPQFDKDLSGLGLAFEGGYLQVVHVALKSPAAEAGWRIGEHITAVDGHIIDSTYFSSNLWRWRFDHPGRTVELRMADRETRKIKLRPYY